MKWFALLAMVSTVTLAGESPKLSKDQMYCLRLARETPLTSPARVVEEQQALYDKCLANATPCQQAAMSIVLKHAGRVEEERAAAYDKCMKEPRK